MEMEDRLISRRKVCRFKSYRWSQKRKYDDEGTRDDVAGDGRLDECEVPGDLS